MSFEEWVRPVALTVFFVLVLWGCDRRRWLLFDATASIIAGLLFVLAPGLMMGTFTTGDLDQATLTMTQMNGMVMIGGALVWLFTRESLDGTVSITLIMSRVFTCSLILLVQVYTYWGTTKGKKKVDWTENMVSFGMYGYLLSLLGNLYFLLYSDDFSMYPQHNIRINTHLRADAWMSLLLATVFLALPDVITGYILGVNVPTCALLHVCRCTGIQMLCSVVISTQAPGFLHERDKRSQFSGRLVSHLLQTLPLGLMCLVSGTLSRTVLSRVLLVTGPILVNAAFGVFADGTVIYRVPNKSY